MESGGVDGRDKSERDDKEESGDKEERGDNTESLASSQDGIGLIMCASEEREEVH